MGDELFQFQASLLQNAPKCSGLKRFVLWHDYRPILAAHDEVRTGLSPNLIAESLQGPGGLSSSQVTR